MKWLCFVLLCLSWSWRVSAAPCCASNNLFPSLISGDEQSQISLTTAHAQILGDALVDGGWSRRDASDREGRTQMRLDVATLISDRWQVGATLPFLHRARNRGGVGNSSLGLGDLSLNVAYEALPVWSYSPWRPKGLVFLGLTAPTGLAPVQSDALFQMDATGRGYWLAQAGTLLQKVWGSWDALFWLEAHQSFRRTLDTPAGPFELVPGPGIAAALGGGWSWDAWRFGALVSMQWESGVRTVGAGVDLQGAPAWSLPVTLQVSRLLADGFSLGMFYSDTSWLAASNVPVARTVTAVLQARTDR